MGHEVSGRIGAGAGVGLHAGGSSEGADGPELLPQRAARGEQGHAARGVEPPDGEEIPRGELPGRLRAQRRVHGISAHGRAEAIDAEAGGRSAGGGDRGSGKHGYGCDGGRRVQGRCAAAGERRPAICADAGGVDERARWRGSKAASQSANVCIWSALATKPL